MLFFYSVLPLLVMLLLACSPVPASAFNPTETMTSEPAATPTVLSSSTPPPTGVFPAIPTQPTKDPSFFRDDFVHTLDTQWSWIREDPTNWSLEIAPGTLQINPGQGYVLAHTNTNLLLRPSPEGNFQIETQITFQPRDNFDFAGLIVYETDSNFIQAGHGFCSTLGCIGEGLYIHSYRKGLAERPGVGQTSTFAAPIFLRLSRRENLYEFAISQDGRVWFLLASQTSDLKPLQVGLVAAQHLSGKSLSAVFEYFEVRGLP
jgi:beta-xylosidase